MRVSSTQFAAEIGDREAIRDCLYRYSRAVDRCDEDLLRSVYWSDATDDHVLFQGDREALIEWVMPTLLLMEQSQHSISNILIRIDGNSADVESYYYGYHRMPYNGKIIDSIQAGRYLDNFEKREDEWRILQRKVVVDWFHDYDEAANWEEGPMGQPIPFGKRKPDDPSYRLLSKLDG